MGTTPFGYEIAGQFGLQVTPLRASLVPYTFSGELKDMFARLSGNAIDVAIKFGKTLFHEAMLFTHRGLSGPVVLQISNYWEPGKSVVVDLLPDIDTEALLLEAKRSRAKVLIRTLVGEHLPKSISQELESLWWPELKDIPVGECSNSKLSAIAAQLNSWELVPAGTEGYKTAEVTLGGVDTDGLSSKTLEAKDQPGLYFVGEVVDVTGHLGGFNFQWAWSSGYACGQVL